MSAADRNIPIRPPQVMDLYLLGRVELPAMLELQKRFAWELEQSEIHRGILVLCEHPRCWTAGTQTPPCLDDQQQESTAVETFATPWPGGRVEHGPGQLAIYPVFHLDRLEISPLRFRDAIEQAVEQVCTCYHLPSQQRLPGMGMNCKAGLVSRGRLHIRRQISQGGIFLNTQTVYELAEETNNSSVQAATMKAVELSAVKTEIVHAFSQWCSQPRLNTFTRHPALIRKFRRPDDRDHS